AERLAARGVPRGIAEALAVPAAAHLVTAPVVAGMVGQVSLIAILANVVAAPVVAPATVLGVLAAVLAQVVPWLARFLVRLAGPEPGPVGECLDRVGVDSVPLVILSHLHADHIGGLAAVLANRRVGAVAVGPARSPGWAWQEVTGDANRAGVPLVRLDLGQRLTWPGLTIDVVGPLPPE